MELVRNTPELKEPAMTEPTTPTVAEKRAVLQANGVAVGTRGKLSAEHEAKYAELTGGTPAPAQA